MAWHLAIAAMCLVPMPRVELAMHGRGRALSSPKFRRSVAPAPALRMRMADGEDTTLPPLNLLIVECYDEAGIANIRAVGCRKASDTFADVLHSISPQPVDITIIHPCDAEYSMASVDELRAAFDGVVWTGSSLTIHEDKPIVHRQIELARRCYAAGLPQYGSCWGLQMSAAAAGLPCEENPKGREQPFARDVTLTAEGLAHPMFDGKASTFDGLCAHTDIVAASWALAPVWPPRCPPGVTAHVLASNEWTPVQALQIRVGESEFWSTQYHPELEVKDVARLMKTPATRKRLVHQGAFETDEELVAYVANLEAAAEEGGAEEGAAAASVALQEKLGLSADVLDPGYRSLELANWLKFLVVPRARGAASSEESDASSAAAAAELVAAKIARQQLYQSVDPPPGSPLLGPERVTADLRGGEVFASAAAAVTSSSSSSVDNPYTGEAGPSVPLLSAEEAAAQVKASKAAQAEWAASTSLEERIALVGRFIEALEADAERVAADISSTMGKPLKQAKGEVMSVRERAEAMMDLAPAELIPEPLDEKANFDRRLEKVPVGVVLCIAPWNYPLLCAVNCIVPAVLSGNAVQIKHSSRTAHAADAFERAFLAAGAPKGLVQALHVPSGPVLDDVISMGEVGFVSFTGSVDVGRKVYSTIASRRFIDATLELGGKDPAYVAADANVQAAVEGVIDGAFYNAGQSCCAIERAYVHEDVYDEFVAAAAKLVSAYQLGDPADEATTLGPLALPSAPAFLSAQVQDAVAKGARLICGGLPCKDEAGKGRFFAPTLLDNCDHTMGIMKDESFGPVLGLQKVSSDEEAASLMNDSDFGLTAIIYTGSAERAEKVAASVDAGTIFMNRCDYLDPYLAWTGMKDSGKGHSLSKHAFRAFTRLKSFHFKLDPTA